MIGVNTKVITKDKRLKDIRRELKNAFATVGIHQEDNTQYVDDDGEKQNVTYAQLGHIFEMGLGQPRRPWLSEGLNENIEVIKKVAQNGIKAVTNGTMKIKTATEMLGDAAALGIVDQISKRPSPYVANKQSTIKKKDGNQPLVHTGGFKARIKSKAHVK